MNSNSLGRASLTSMNSNSFVRSLLACAACVKKSAYNFLLLYLSILLLMLIVNTSNCFGWIGSSISHSVFEYCASLIALLFNIFGLSMKQKMGKIKTG